MSHALEQVVITVFFLLSVNLLSVRPAVSDDGASPFPESELGNIILEQAIGRRYSVRE